jgi:hypothetical protein
MGALHRSMAIQAVVIIMLLFLFTGILAAFGSIRTLDVPEQRIQPVNATATAPAVNGLMAIPTSAPVFADPVFSRSDEPEI